MYEILKGEEEWMGELFESIMEWILDIPINNKLIWIRIKGLPQNVCCRFECEREGKDSVKSFTRVSYEN